MIAKRASVFALSLLALGAIAAQAQNQPIRRPDRPFPFPQFGSWSGTVQTMGWRPIAIPVAGTTGTASANNANSAGGSGQQLPPIASPPIGIPFDPPMMPVSGATVQLTLSDPGTVVITNQDQRAGANRPFPQRSYKTLTDQGGSFGFKELPFGTFKYRVTHPDFLAAEGSTFVSPQGVSHQIIQLRRKPNTVGSFSGRVTVLPRLRPPPYVKGTDARPPAPGGDAGAVDAGKDDAASEPVDAAEAAADKLTEPEPGAPADAVADASQPAVAAVDPAIGAPVSAGGGTGAIVGKRLWLGRPLANAVVEITAAPFWQPMPLPGPVPVPEPFPAPQPLPPVKALGSDATGAVAGGAVEQKGGFMPPLRSWRAETDRDGRFGVKGLPQGFYTFRVTHKYFQARGGSFFVGQFDPSVFRNIQLERRVRGVFAGVVGEGPRILLPGDPLPPVTTNTGGGVDQAKASILPFKFQPLSGARVLVMRSRRFYPRPIPMPVPLAGGAPAPTATAAPAANDAAKADADEEAQLLKASEDANAGAEAATDDAALDAVDAEEEAIANPPADLKGGGPGFIGPPITIRPPWYRRAVTNEKGHFRIAKLPAGTYRFVVRAKDHQPQVGKFSISRRQPRATRRILLPSGGGPVELGSLSGVVLTYGFDPREILATSGANANNSNNSGAASPGAQGTSIMPPQQIRPVAGATVSLQAIAPPGMAVIQMLQTTTTDANGNFVFKQLGGGRFIMYVDAKGYFASKQEVSMASGSQALKVFLKPAVFGNPPADQVEQPNVNGSDAENPFGK